MLSAGAAYAQEAVIQEEAATHTGKNKSGVFVKVFPRKESDAGHVSQTAAKPELAKQEAAATSDKLIASAEALMNAGKPAEAYALLEPLDFERAGEVNFDYLLGIAALDSGKADKATLAFERVLAVDPNFAGARLDMARAYYQLGDMARAKAEFEEVLKQNPPKAALAATQKYLDAIKEIEEAKLLHVSGYAEGVTGYDNNIASSSTQTFTFPANSPWSGLFPGNQLPPSSPLKAFYEGINAGVEASRRLNESWGVFAGTDVHQHGNQTYSAYDSKNMDGRAGVMYTRENNAYKVSLTGGSANSANTMYRTSRGMNAEWQHVFNPFNQVSVFGQYGGNRASGYPATSPTTDARIEGDTDQTIVGVGWVRALTEGKHVLFGSVYYGRESDAAPVISAGLPDGGRVDGQKIFKGLRIGGQRIFSETVNGMLSMGWQSANYGKLNNMIMDNRSEQLYDLSIAANWRLNKLWTVKPQVVFSKKNSNISLYSADRGDVSLTIRRDFK